MTQNIMVYLAVDRDGTECIFEDTPYRGSYLGGDKKDFSHWNSALSFVTIPKGTIKKLTGKDLTFEDGYRTYVGDDYDPTPE